MSTVFNTESSHSACLLFSFLKTFFFIVVKVISGSWSCVVFILFLALFCFSLWAACLIYPKFLHLLWFSPLARCPPPQTNLHDFPLCSFLTWNTGTEKPASPILSVGDLPLGGALLCVVLETELRVLTQVLYPEPHPQPCIFIMGLSFFHVLPNCRWRWSLSEARIQKNIQLSFQASLPLTHCLRSVHILSGICLSLAPFPFSQEPLLPIAPQEWVMTVMEIVEEKT